MQESWSSSSSHLHVVCSFTSPPHSFVSIVLPTGAQKHDDNGAKAEVEQKHALAKGTICEFEEKKRVHVGKITASEHKSNGGVRYTVEEAGGKSFSVADKQVNFAVAAPAADGKAEKMLADFEVAMAASVTDLSKALDVDPETLELTWETAAEDDAHDHSLTAKSFIDLVHSRAPTSALETYRAWRLLCSDLAHVFFKSVKNHGRVESFKAKAVEAVDAAKITFCNKDEHSDDDFCFV